MSISWFNRNQERERERELTKDKSQKQRQQHLFMKERSFLSVSLPLKKRREETSKALLSVQFNYFITRREKKESGNFQIPNSSLALLLQGDDKFFILRKKRVKKERKLEQANEEKNMTSCFSQAWRKWSDHFRSFGSHLKLLPFPLFFSLESFNWKNGTLDEK